MMDKIQVKYDIERCISHVPDACRDCSHYTGTVGFGCMEDLLADALALLKEQEEQIKNRDESLEKAREEIKWLRGMLKEHEAVKPKIDAFGHPYCPKCKVLVYETWKFCPHCGQEMKCNE